MGKTTIEWSDYSWPVVNGCRRISPGCGGSAGVGGCYAERLTATRLSKTPKYKGLAVLGEHGPRWTGEARLWRKDLEMPLRLRKPSRIFVADMGDLFYEAVPNETIAAVFGVMAQAPQHTFQVLTKRPKRMREWFRWVERDGDPHAPPADHVVSTYAANIVGDIDQLARPWPLPNVWIGTSVEDQKRADERIPDLLETPAALRFLSVEPLLEPVDLAPYLAVPGGIHWVIVGGESGPGARPFDIAWARAIIAQCKAAGVPVFVKQVGSSPFNSTVVETGVTRAKVGGETTATFHFQSPDMPLEIKDRKGGDMAEWPEDLRVRDFPRGSHV